MGGGKAIFRTRETVCEQSVGASDARRAIQARRELLPVGASKADKFASIFHS
jgi:hypothetical protein